MTVQYLPAYQNLQFMQALADQAELPANAVALTKSNTAPTGLSAAFTAGKFLRGADGSIATGGGSWSDAEISSVAAHLHMQLGDNPDETGSATTHMYVAAGGHGSEHNVTLTVTEKLKKAYVRAWTKTSAFAPAAGMIAMIELLNIPEGWLLCDGTNGTPDLRDCFIVLNDDGTVANTGTNEAGLSGSLSSVSHHHDGGEWQVMARDVFIVWYGYHANSVSHSHTVSGDVDYEPPYYPLVFVMKAA